MAARLADHLAEVSKQWYAPAMVCLGVAKEGAQTGLASRPLSGGALVDEMADSDGIAGIVEQQAICRETVSPGAADFLVIGFGVFRKVIMEDETDVGFVDPHAKSDGGHHERDLVLQELILIALAQVIAEPGVIG